MPDAIVIGGGVMGLASARELRRRGWRVVLLERGQPGRAASWASAGIIGATTRDESDPGYELRQVSHALWPDFARGLLEEAGLDPEYRENGCLYLATDAAELAWLRRLAERDTRRGPGDNTPHRSGDATPGQADPTRGASGARPERAGATGGQPETGGRGETGSRGETGGQAERTPGQGGRTRGQAASTQNRAAAQLLDQAALAAAEPALSRDIPGGLFLSGGNVEPRRLCRALEIAARRVGVDVRSGVTVRALSTSGERVTGVETDDATLGADAVVLAAGAWSAGIGGVQPAVPVRPQRGQILALDQARVGVRHVLLTAGDPYFVPRCDGRLVIGATREEAGWDPSLTAGGVAWLLNRAMMVVPALAECPIAETWTGFRPASADGLPLIGPAALPGLYVLTGHGPSGISPMPGSVALLVALLLGERPPLDPAPFNPLRFAAAPRPTPPAVSARLT